jgi:hypothetical protein
VSCSEYEPSDQTEHSESDGGISADEINVEPLSMESKRGNYIFSGNV